MPATRVLIACPLLLAEGLQHILQDSFAIVGLATSREKAIRMTEAMRPVVLLLDGDLAEPDGVDVLQQLRRGMPKVRVVLICRKTHSLALRCAIDTGVAGLVLTQQPSQELCDAVRLVAKGGVYIAPALQGLFAWSRGGKNTPREKQRTSLTPRQQQVLQLLAEGRTNKEMAILLHISCKTVEFHRALLMRELGLRTVAELSRFAMHSGLVGPKN